MLFHLSPEFAEQDSAAHGADPSFQSLIGELLRAHRTGRHELVAERRVWAWLSPTLTHLGILEQGVAGRLAGDSYRLRAALVACPGHVEVVPGARWGERRPGAPLRVPWGSLAPNGSLPPSVLLGEDVTRDAALYRQIAGVVAKARGWRIELSLRGGGGNATGANLKQAAKEGSVVVAVVDQDRRAPNAAIRDTPWNALRAAAEWGAMTDPLDHGRGALPAELARTVARVVVLPARTIENLITPELWSRLFGTPLGELTLRTLGPGVWVEAKKGPKCRAGIGKDAEATYLRTRFPDVGWCADLASCAEGKGETCERRPVPGLGDKAIPKVTAALVSLPLDSLDESHLGEPLWHVGRIIAMWGRAAEPMRA